MASVEATIVVDGITNEQARDLYWEASGNADQAFADQVREALRGRMAGTTYPAEFDAFMDYRI